MVPGDLSGWIKPLAPMPMMLRSGQTGGGGLFGERRALARLILLVTAGALAVCAGELIALWKGPAPAVWRIGLAAGLLLASRLAIVHLRFRGQRIDFDWGEGALLLCLVLLPTPWLTLLTPVCLAAAGIVLGRPSVKTVYNAASATVATAVAGTAANALYDTTTTALSWRLVGALGVAALLFTVVADLSASAAIALSQSERLLPTLRVGVGMELLTGAGNVCAALAVVAIARFDAWLVITLPMLVGAIQITYSSRMRAQHERHAWTQLETTTRAFTQLDPLAVAAAAVTGIAELFQADRVEVRFRSPNGHNEHYSGGREGLAGPAQDPPPDGPTLTVPLGRPDEDAGTVTLHFRADVTLNARESHALATLATALAVALANAERYETTRGFAEAKAQEAVTDSLTGVGNRALLRDAGAGVLAEAVQGGRAGALLLVDLDHFKEVNDTLGYDTGDRLLVEVARRLTGSVDGPDLVVRLGSHEFAVLLADAAGRAPEHVAERLIACLDEPMVLDGLLLHAPASIGIAGFPGDAGDVRDLLRLADVALLRAKGSATRWVRYAADQDQPHADRLATVEESRAAMANGEFVLYYQPKVEVRTGEITGAEALIRWHHPTRGLLSPDKFMTAIEHSALVHDFTLNVLRMGLRDCAGWLAEQAARSLAVNLSPRNLLHPGLPDAVLELLRTYAVPSTQLVLEVTETAIMSDLDTVDTVLAQLRAGGVQLSLDDFGTGYSSLTFLSRIPVDEVKIDRSFVSRMLTSSRDDVVVRGTISLARGLGLRVVAEGVETREEHERLVELGCERAQGYFYGRPMPVEVLRELPAILPVGGHHPRPTGVIPVPRSAQASEPAR
ncbi:MAG: bifunctional diguanylate cyclase/phosphodiesterase [Pseudonocardiales bacterium]|nr:MAG: bifunctional diguanylate cyclase/phosphodiesterase [Pseudonocardiales bacterium]